MDSFDTRTETVEEPRARRPLSSRLADLGDRIARALPPPRRGPEYSFPVGAAAVATERDRYEAGPDPYAAEADPYAAEADPYAAEADPYAAEADPYAAEADPHAADADPHRTAEFRVQRIAREPVDDILPRFPVTRQGYDCNAVDIHIAELEEELDDLERQLDDARAAAPSRDAVAAQIERVGEQTSAILVAAHDEARETIRLAKAQSDTLIAEATSHAAALTDEATRKVSELEQRAEALDREHERRLTELRSTAGALQSLADAAATRFSPAA